VTEQVLELDEQLGGFGELVYAGMDWADEALSVRSLKLMAEAVMPAVNKHARLP